MSALCLFVKRVEKVLKMHCFDFFSSNFEYMGIFCKYQLSSESEIEALIAPFTQLPNTNIR